MKRALELQDTCAYIVSILRYEQKEFLSFDARYWKNYWKGKNEANYRR